MAFDLKVLRDMVLGPEKHRPRHFMVPDTPAAAAEKALREQRDNWEALEEERLDLLKRLNRTVAEQDKASQAIICLESWLEGQ